MGLISKLRSYILAGSLTLAPVFAADAYAQDIFIGRRGPTNAQLDGRISYSQSRNGTRTLANSMIFKYWDGDRFGKWGFVSLPYKFIDSPNGHNDGLGDISIGFGLRGRINNFHWFSYGALMLPTGDSEGIALGTGRYDKRMGLLTTYLTPDKKFEIDGLLEYKVVGENREGINLPNELKTGFIAGGEITDKIRFATGLTGLIRETNCLINSRSVIRYTSSRSLYFELVGDVGINSRNTTTGKSIGFQARYNF
ncbi:MAG TPA: hypothetical protein ENH99_01230 [Candidatus Pacearchaeota archaeon]|nr:hypothetical protein [Candidatus Pacearchaeota archaeon]